MHLRVQAFSSTCSTNGNPSHLLCSSICKPCALSLSLFLSICSSSLCFDWMCVILMCIDYVCAHFVMFLASCTGTYIKIHRNSNSIPVCLFSVESSNKMEYFICVLFCYS